MDASSNTQVLFGTNINTNEVQNKLRDFIVGFTDIDENSDNYDIYPHYIKQLKEIRDTQNYVLDVDCEHIFKFDAGLYKKIEMYPTDIIPIFDLVVTGIFKEEILRNDDGDQDPIIQVRPFNLKTHHRMRDLEPKHIDKLVSIKGIVIRCSDVVPEMKEACFKCFKCQNEYRSFISRGKIMEPDTCHHCKNKYTYQLIHNGCYFSDKQHVKMQEVPESVPEGETPYTVHLCAYEDFVDFVKPGDRVEVIGIYRAQGVRVNPNQRVLKNVYRTYIDVINYVKVDKKRLNVDTNKEGRDVMMEEDNEHAVDDLGLGEEREEIFSAN